MIEEVMQQKAPGVPSNIKIQQPQNSSNSQGVRKRLTANFFKATFSSRSKAVPTAVSSSSVEDTTKIGSAETKPVTRNRPRSVSQIEDAKSIVKKGIERSKPVNRSDKPQYPERPLRTKQLAPDKEEQRTPNGQKPQNDLKSPNVVFQIVKKSVTPKQVPKTSDSILPPSLKPKLPEKTKLKLTKLINNNNVWSNANVDKLKRAPPTHTRGQQGKQEPTLKGAPSVSSLDSKHHKVAPSREKPLKIFGSKEKLHKAHKKKDLGNNNAVLEDPELREVLEYEDGHVRTEYGSAEELESVGERGSQECISLPVMLNADHMPGFQEVELRPRIPSEASLGSGVREVEALRRELEASSAERAQLQAQLADLQQRAAEADRLRAELDRLKTAEREREAAMERLADENGALRARLRGVAHSPLSDSEKRQLLLAPAPRRMHSSAPASIALAHNGEGDSGDASTPEWDKHSSSSLSEVSVACLQDRILQMEEHHYSTSEELQATLAELADLQSQLADAHADNERLADEKQVLLESLCRQTEKLEDSRTKVDTLQELLLREGVEPETLGSGDIDQQIFAVLKMTQEERRLLLSKQEQSEAELTEVKTALEEKTKENEALNERVRSLEAALERAEGGRAHWEQEAGAARELAAARQHQLATLGELLDAAKAKLAGAAEGAAAAEAAAARREAEAAAARAHALAERLAHAQRQLDRAHDDARRLHDDALVTRNNAKSTISELEFQLEQLRQEKAALQGELNTLQENMSELQIQVQVASDEKLSLMSRAGEARARAADLERQLQDARARCAQLARDRDRDEAEWKQFQSDLLMTVRVANDFKTEAQRELERLVSENKAARDRIRLLEDQIHSFKGVNSSESTGSAQSNSDDEKFCSNESNNTESQSDSSPKDIFRNIRTRYLSRVHSVSDPPLKDTSLVDQAFFKQNGTGSKENFKLDIENVTVDETNDDDASYKDESFDSTNSYDDKIKTEAVLTPFEHKELTRQHAIDFCDQKLSRQDALDSPNILDVDNCENHIGSKSISTVNKKQSKEETISNTNFTALYNCKVKSFSMDNINTKDSFKDVLEEATSIEFLGSHNFSDISVHSDGSDSVFLSSPIEKNNNKISEIQKNNLLTQSPKKFNNLSDVLPQLSVQKKQESEVSITKAMLPLAYSQDRMELLQNVEVGRMQHENTTAVKLDEGVEQDLKMVNEQLKLTFKEALDRIDSNNKNDIISTKLLGNSDVVKSDNSCNNTNSDKINEDLDMIPSRLSYENENNILKNREKDSNGWIKMDDNVNKINETFEELSEPVILNTDTKPQKTPDEVTYRLKIHTLNDAPESAPATVEKQISNIGSNFAIKQHKVRTFLAPINIVNADITDGKTSPIIISPVLIRPIFFKQNSVDAAVQKHEASKGTVYYDDIDQVVVDDRIDTNKLIESRNLDCPKKKGIYQKNIKGKHLPFLGWKSSTENFIESDSCSSNKFSKSVDESKTNIGRISKTPEWLIDNDYYQAIDNTPLNDHQDKDQIKTSCVQGPLDQVKLKIKRKESDQENYYEEIGQPTSFIEQGKNIADDEKISSQRTELDDFLSVAREEILKVPRRPKRPKKQEAKRATLNPEQKPNIVKEMTNITKSVISLSRSPSAKDLMKKYNDSLKDVSQNMNGKQLKGEVKETVDNQKRKHSLQFQQGSNVDTNTGSLPREPKTYHWKTLEHKRLSHPIRSLNNNLPSRPLPLPPREEAAAPPLLSSASLQDIMASAASHRRAKGVSRQDSRLSVKSLIESIENAAKAAKQAPAAAPSDWPQTAAPDNGTCGAEGGAASGAASGSASGALGSKPPARPALPARPAPAPAAWRHETGA